MSHIASVCTTCFRQSVLKPEDFVIIYKEVKGMRVQESLSKTCYKKFKKKLEADGYLVDKPLMEAMGYE